jgi:DNA-binding PucR family transcriptional regulator
LQPETDYQNNGGATLSDAMRARAIVTGLLDRDSETRRRLAAVLEPLAKHDRRMREKLLATLSAYVETGHSIAATSRLLKLHRHTVDYRLRKIEEILGRSVRGGPDMVLISLAVLASDDLAEERRA